MNNPNQNNYIQYLTKNDIVKTRNVVFVDNGTTTTFKVEGIIEEYFILAVFQNNLRVMGVGFENIENNDMLGFLNSELSDISLIPSYAFLPPEQVVTMSYNNDYLKGISNNVPAADKVNVSKYQYDPFRYWIDLNRGNLEIEGFSLYKELPETNNYIKEGVYTDIDGSRVYQNDIFEQHMQLMTPFLLKNDYVNAYYHFLGFYIKCQISNIMPDGMYNTGSRLGIDFLVDRKHDIFDLVPRYDSLDAVEYLGMYRGTHVWRVSTFDGFIFNVECYYRVGQFLNEMTA